MAHTPRRTNWASIVICLIVVASLVAGCGVSTGAGTAPTPTATPVPTCATALPGSMPINLAAHGFVYPMEYPASTVSGTITTTASGPGLFTVYQFMACTPGTTITDVQSFYNTHLPALPHGWIATTIFPADGGLMIPCSAPCLWDPKGGDFYYLVFDQFTTVGGVVTYRGRWADFDISKQPTCNSNFSHIPPAQANVYFIGGGTSGFPLPPASATVPDNAAGGLRGYDVCSSGTAASVSAFLTKEVPAAGWTKVVTSDPHCTDPANCWTKGGQFWSWGTITDPTDWIVSYRMPLA